LCNGIISGLTIGLLATAFNAVYLPSRVFHIALAAVCAAAPFLVWQCMVWRIPWALAVMLAVLLGAASSAACEAFNHAPLNLKRASQGAHLISSLGLYIAGVQVITLIWGNDTKILRVGLDSVLTVGQLTLTRAQLAAGITSLLLVSIYYVGLRFTGLGLKLRALADNPIQLALHGVNTARLRILAFALAGLLASVSAILIAYDIGFDPHGGLTMLLLAIVAAIIGGRDTWLGPALGGIALGLVRSQVVWFLSARWQDAISFSLLALFLFLRPQGILGHQTRTEAQA